MIGWNKKEEQIPEEFKKIAKNFSEKGLKIAGTLAPFLGFCDMRLKTDVSPLEITEVNDDLAQIAFFVKELHECS